jgi:hypothetical protein
MIIIMIVTVILSGDASVNSNYDTLFQKRYYPSTIPGRFNTIGQENKSGYTTAHYLVYAPGESNSYVAFVGKYKMYSLGIKVIDTVYPEDEFLELVTKYYYFVVLKEDEKIVQFMSQYVDKKNYVGIYKSSDIFKKKIN